ncbi:hypothetical protein [Sulfobacillus harzensis]|uniref:Uncharacterized protein n=1 Tax=Sulfobacillus harzensis TaxID=2729629 RepID=A0A7Y0Q339_9FIRM|nr:hypothetical protein [Sulfobacillus harzensis]NMP23808.1 hypothetical protein [Sulfobacillus harzensis]
MSYGRFPYYIWSGEGLHIWSDRTPTDREPILASPQTYNEGENAEGWNPQPMHVVILPYEAVRQLLTRWLEDRHPDLVTPALLAAIEKDFADDADGGTRGTLVASAEEKGDGPS